MIGDSMFCCLPVDIAVRLIGTITLLTNALVFIALVSDSDAILTDEKIRILFGFDSKFFVKLTIDLSDNVELFHIFCLVFTVVYAISSAVLLWASVIRKCWLILPWLICSFFNIICHFASIMMLPFACFSEADKWVTAFTVFYSVTILYFTLVAMSAFYIWHVESQERCKHRETQDVWENIYRSPPLFESPYKNQVLPQELYFFFVPDFPTLTAPALANIILSFWSLCRRT